MNINKFQFQVKKPDDTEWKFVSDIVFMDELYRYVDKATPHVKTMLHGEEIWFNGTAFRIICRGTQ